MSDAHDELASSPDVLEVLSLFAEYLSNDTQVIRGTSAACIEETIKNPSRPGHRFVNRPCAEDSSSFKATFIRYKNPPNERQESVP